MAPVKLKNVVSFSSQDPVHCVNNLLELNQWRRWLCAPGDKSGSGQAEFQLERAVKIGFIDIGNYGAALIEIQVRRSSASNDEFKTIVPTTSCMTPMDSKQGKNKTGVKMFTRDQLCENVRDELWDRVKVICRQPFKKDAQFGLAFIKISSVDDKKEDRTVQHEAKAGICPPVQQPTKHRDKSHIFSPSWKTSAAFQKQFATLNRQDSTVTADLKNRLLKIKSTSTESKPMSEDSLGRAAKLILAASGKKGLPSSSPSAATTPLTPSATNRDNPGLPSAYSTSVQLSSVQSSSKFNLLPSSSLSTAMSENVPSKRRKNRKSVLEETPDEKILAFEIQVKEFLASVGMALKDATLTELWPLFEAQLGRKVVRTERATFKRLASHAVEALDDPAGTDVPDIGLRRTSNLENGWLQAKPNPTLSPGNLGGSHNSPSTSQFKGRKLPSWMNSVPPGDGKPCPKCQGMYPASRMNTHILDCHGRSGSPNTSQNHHSHMAGQKRRAVTPSRLNEVDAAVKRQVMQGTKRLDMSGQYMGVIPAGFMQALCQGRGRSEGGRGGRRKEMGSAGNVTKGEEVDVLNASGRGRGRGRGGGQNCSRKDEATPRQGRGRTKGKTGNGKRGAGFEPVTPLIINICEDDDSDSDEDTNFILNTGISYEVSNPDVECARNLVPCPICMEEFPQTDIVVHAALCGDVDAGGMLDGGFVRDVGPVTWID